MEYKMLFIRTESPTNSSSIDRKHLKSYENSFLCPLCRTRMNDIIGNKSQRIAGHFISLTNYNVYLIAICRSCNSQPPIPVEINTTSYNISNLGKINRDKSKYPKMLGRTKSQDLIYNLPKIFSLKGL